MNAAVLVIILSGQPTCEPQIRSDLIPEHAEVYCIAADRAPLTSPRPQARPATLETDQ